MLVKLEPSNKETHALVVDEIDRFFGEIARVTFFTQCVQENEPTEIDEELYYTVDKEKIVKFCKK